MEQVICSGPALNIEHSPVRVYLAHAGQPGQAGSDHPAEKQPKSLLKTQENRKANLLPEIGNFREQSELSKSANVEGKYVKNAKQFHWILILQFEKRNSVF